MVRRVGVNFRGLRVSSVLSNTLLSVFVLVLTYYTDRAIVCLG